MLTHYS
jgi:NhaP-type Na+/H+ or K+/H+ antiporter